MAAIVVEHGPRSDAAYEMPQHPWLYFIIAVKCHFAR